MAVEALKVALQQSVFSGALYVLSKSVSAKCFISRKSLSIRLLFPFTVPVRTEIHERVGRL